jgi:hypothetical protein
VFVTPLLSVDTKYRKGMHNAPFVHLSQKAQGLQKSVLGIKYILFSTQLSLQ